MIVRITVLVAALLFVPVVYCADIPFEFVNADQEGRYQQLTEELRCLVCQNQSLADSHADLAQDLRDEIYQMVLDGKTNAEIIDFMVARYGDFVLYRPPVKGSTWLLWFAPFMLLIVAITVIILIARSRSTTAIPELSQAEQDKLTHLLGDGQGEKQK